jgi:hypothetical protein
MWWGKNLILQKRGETVHLQYLLIFPMKGTVKAGNFVTCGYFRHLIVKICNRRSLFITVTKILNFCKNIFPQYILLNISYFIVFWRILSYFWNIARAVLGDEIYFANLQKVYQNLLGVKIFKNVFWEKSLIIRRTKMPVFKKILSTVSGTVRGWRH